jgi:hypothetical protein
MDTVSITAGRRISIEDLKSLIERYWPTERGHNPERLVVDGPTSRIYIRYARSEDGVVDPNRIYLAYHSVPFVKELIMIIANDPEVVVENDFGTVLPGNEFVARLRSDPSWEWRV